MKKSFSCDWIIDCKRRYSDLREKVNAESIENNRAQINPKEVDRYITSVEDVMKDSPPPIWLLNFYQIRFSKMVNKYKKKYC